MDFQFTQHTVINLDRYQLKHHKKIYDSIHGYIYFDKICWDIIDTPVFQRLRQLKQLGVTDMVFNGGSHSRFQHSMGTAYLARKQMEYILKKQPYIFENNQEQQIMIKNVQIAGLCHDLGHGPFSHCFDGMVIPKIKPGCTWTHEDGSMMLFEYMIDEYNIDLNKDDVRLVQNLINGYHHEECKDYVYKFIFDIVANKRNSIDVDKFDYMTRDSHQLGIKDTYFDYNSLMKQARVINDEICYPYKYAHKVYELFHARLKLFKNIYLNRGKDAISLMIRDILFEANSKYDFIGIIQDPERYYQLNDSIIYEIERSEDPRLKKARDLVQKIRKREIYKFVAEALLPPQFKLYDIEKMKQNIANYQKLDGEKDTQIFKDDIEIIVSTLNYCAKDQNPVDSVKFYCKEYPNNSFNIEKDKVSLLLPQHFQEKCLRVYVKDIHKLEAVKKAFKKYCKKEMKLEMGVVEGFYSQMNEKERNQIEKILELRKSSNSSGFKQNINEKSKSVTFFKTPQKTPQKIVSNGSEKKSSV